MAYRTEIEKLEQRHSENPKQWFAALADAYRKQGDVDLAIEYVKGGIDLRPDYASAHIVLGRCYLDKEMDDEAAGAFEQVIQLDAENIIALKSLGDIAERQGDKSGARQWLNRLLEVDPMNEEIAECLERLGPEEEQDEKHVEESEIGEMAPELDAEDPASEDTESAAEAVPEPMGLEPTVSEEAIDLSSLDASPMALDSAPMMLDATLPMDTSPEGEDEAGPDTAEPIDFEVPGEGIEVEDVVEPIDLEMPGVSDVAGAGIEPIELETPVFGASSVSTDDAIEPLEIVTEEAEAISLVGSGGDDDDPDEATTGGGTVIEPFELEHTDGGVRALFDGMSDAYEPEDADETITAELEPVELEVPNDDAGSLKSDVSDGAEAAGIFDEPPAEIAIVEVEEEAEIEEEEIAEIEGVGEVEEDAAVDLDAVSVVDEVDGDTDSLISGVSDGAEPAGVFDYLDAGFEGVEVEEIEEEEQVAEIAGFEEVAGDEGEEDAVDVDAVSVVDEVDDEVVERASVPPTTEVAAVDLEAMRAADARSMLDADEADEEDVEAPIEVALEDFPQTTEIDAVELERLREQDALVAGVTEEADTDAEEAEEEAAAERVEVAEVETEEETVAGEEFAETVAEDPLPLILPEEDVGESQEAAEPEPVVTETMAEVYARQGLYGQAREIYEVLAMQHPDDPRLKARVEELSDLASSVLQETRQSRFSVAATGGESAATYLQRLFQPVEAVLNATVAAPETPQAPEPGPEPTPLEQAFSDNPPESLGEPTVPAGDEVSLASVFDGSVPVPPPSVEDVPESEEGVSYDEFYGTDASNASSEANESQSDDESSDDEDNFKDWLEGLKT